jgi:hypothetical protein
VPSFVVILLMARVSMLVRGERPLASFASAAIGIAGSIASAEIKTPRRDAGSPS